MSGHDCLRESCIHLGMCSVTKIRFCQLDSSAVNMADGMCRLLSSIGAGYVAEMCFGFILYLQYAYLFSLVRLAFGVH